jgi:hypothetical protein
VAVDVSNVECILNAVLCDGRMHADLTPARIYGRRTLILC